MSGSFRTLAGACLLIVVLLVAGCGGSSNTSSEVYRAYPEGFLWGTATSGFQVDMGCPSDPCPDSRGDWHQWATHPDIIEEGLVSGDTIREAPGQWSLYERDVRLMDEVLHNNGYRLSIEWSRLFPTSTEGISGYENLRELASDTALRRYHRLLDELNRRGIVPLVTLNHYNLPLWIHDGVACHKDPSGCEDRGWLEGDRLIPEMTKFARFVAREFGGKVDLWATLNEPYAVIVPGYILPDPNQRTNPPGIYAADHDTDLSYARTVTRNMIVAHARMYDAIHASDNVSAHSYWAGMRLRGSGREDRAASVGLVPNLAPMQPDDPNRDTDVRAAENADYLYNRLFLNALVDGKWDTDFDGEVDRIREDLKGRMDYVGINYYTPVKVRGLGDTPVPELPLLNFYPTDTYQYYPRGLYEMARFVEREYGLPSIITENGTDQDGLSDTHAKTYVVDHLGWLRKAIADGADVRGYFYWTLVDNYEWNHGYDFTMGMFAYDHATKERTAKDVAETYGTIAERNRIPVFYGARFGDSLPKE